MPIPARCADAAALLAGLPAGEQAEALAAHRESCPRCAAALASLRDDLTDEAAIGGLLAARAAARLDGGRPPAPLRPVLRPAIAGAAGTRRPWPLVFVPPLALAGTAAALVVLLAGVLALGRFDSGDEAGLSQATERKREMANQAVADTIGSRTATAAPLSPPPQSQTGAAAAPESSPESSPEPSPEASPSASPAASAPPPAPQPPAAAASPPAAVRPSAASTPPPTSRQAAAPTAAGTAPDSSPPASEMPRATGAPPSAGPATPAPAAAPAAAAPAPAAATSRPAATTAATTAPQVTPAPRPATATPAAPPATAAAPAPATPAPFAVSPAPAAAPAAPPVPATAGMEAARPTAIVAALSMVTSGATVSVTAQTTAGATCTIDAGPLGAGSELALGARQADRAGRVSWTWTAAAVPPGEYRVSVTCQGSRASVPIVVTG